MKSKSLAVVIFVVAVIGLIAVFWEGLTEDNQAGYITIAQWPFTGQLNVQSEPGMVLSMFGEVYEYKQAGTYRFGKDSTSADSAHSEPVKVRFNDGGTASVAGNARFELPSSNHEAMLKIHKAFRSYPHIARTLVQPAITEALILTANLMSAEESYSGRRAEFSQLAWDQVTNGIYLTEWEDRETVDELTGEKKSKRLVHIKKDADGIIIRKQNPLADYEITISQFFLDEDLDYEPGILQQISNQRDAMMKTVAAKAEAEKAQQDRVTAEAQGQAMVMTAKYEAEVEKERAVVEARKRKEVAETEGALRLAVARLDKDSAAEYRDAQILRAEGDAEYKQRVMSADGALEQKLAAWVDVNKRYAEAIQGYEGQWVPGVVMGGQGGNGNGAAGALDLVSLLTAKTARDLSLDLGITETPAAK